MFSMIEAIKALTSNGDTFVTIYQLYHYCMACGISSSQEQFHHAFQCLVAQKALICSGGMVSLAQVAQYENITAQLLQRILSVPSIAWMDCPQKIDPSCRGVSLSEEQMAAVRLALSHRLSIIQGGAGTGKTTLIQAIVRESGLAPEEVFLCSPTGKAAANLSAKTGMPAATIHGLCQATWGYDFTLAAERTDLRLLIADEASMISLDLLTGILRSAGDLCRIVLLGDPNQLDAVNCGNALNDLLSLGFPSLTLRQGHRQADHASALYNNIERFSSITDSTQLAFDDSFQFIEAEEDELFSTVLALGTDLVRSGGDCMILSPLREPKVISSEVTTTLLNACIQSQVHTPGDRRLFISADQYFAEGDPVMFQKNNRAYPYFNGEHGVFHITENGCGSPSYWVSLPSGRAIPIEPYEAGSLLTLAYACTVHKAQGSEYDTVIIPLSDAFSPMSNRSLFYTSISRSKKKVILVGTESSLSCALSRQPHARQSLLVPKVRKLLRQAAG